MKTTHIGSRQFQLSEFMVACLIIGINLWLLDKPQPFANIAFLGVLPVVYYALISVFIARRSMGWSPLRALRTALMAMLLAIPGAGAWCSLQVSERGIGTSAAFAFVAGGLASTIYATVPLCGAITVDSIIREVTASRRAKIMLRAFMIELRDWFLAALDVKEKRFRTELRSRNPNDPNEETGAEYSDSYRACAQVLRRVLSEELQFDNLRLSDNLLANSNDLPIDEVLRDVSEVFDLGAELPTLGGWDGSFGHLVRLVDQHRQRRGAK